MLSVSGFMEPLPRLYLPTTIENIRHYSSAISMASKFLRNNFTFLNSVFVLFVNFLKA